MRNSHQFKFLIWLLFSHPTVQRMDTQFPVRPNGVTISYFEVQGGLLETPTLIERPLPTAVPVGSGSLSEGMGEQPSPEEGTEYRMVVSSFEVTYGVLACGFDTGLLVGSYDDAYDAAAVVGVESVSTIF